MLLSIDPGITSAYAILGDDWGIIATGTCQPERLEEVLSPRSRTFEGYRITNVVIEDTPIPTHSAMNRQLRDVVTSLSSWYPRADRIRPGVWKTHAAAHASTPRGLTTHEGDAIRLGLYWLTTQRGR